MAGEHCGDPGACLVAFRLSDPPHGVQRQTGRGATR
jgi:hypothetical protein